MPRHKGAKNQNPNPKPSYVPSVISMFEKMRNERKRREEEGAYTFTTAIGRKPALECDDFTLQIIFLTATRQCPKIECAAMLGVAPSTFNRFLDENEIARDAWEDGRAFGCANLRAKLFELADQGNPQVLLHMANVYLGHREAVGGDDTRDIIEQSADAFDSALAEFLARRRAKGVPGAPETGGPGTPSV